MAGKQNLYSFGRTILLARRDVKKYFGRFCYSLVE